MKADNIEKGNYEGYVWMSDQSEPQKIDGEYSNELNPNQNPFIIEAQLFDKDRNVSYSIKYTDGQYYCHRFVVNPLDYTDVEIKQYEAHRMLNNKGLQFLRYWREVEDVNNLCCGMKTLQPAELVFVGFCDKKEN